MKKVSGQFKRERECKHSVRYAPINEEAKAISSIIYVGKKCLATLMNPTIIRVDIIVDEE